MRARKRQLIPRVNLLPTEWLSAEWLLTGYLPTEWIPIEHLSEKEVLHLPLSSQVERKREKKKQCLPLSSQAERRGRREKRHYRKRNMKKRKTAMAVMPLTTKSLCWNVLTRHHSKP